MSEAYIGFKKVPVIAVDGVDLSGKSSAIAYAVDVLTAAGYRVKVIKRPGEVGREMIRRWQLGEATTEQVALAMRADAASVNRVLSDLPPAHLEGGFHAVILDRHYLSAVALQGEDLATMIRLFGEPDRHILFDVGTATAMKRLRNRSQGGLAEDPISHAATREAFRQAAKPLFNRGVLSIVDTTNHPDPLMAAREIAYWVARLSSDVAEVREDQWTGRGFIQPR